MRKVAGEGGGGGEGFRSQFSKFIAEKLTF